MNSLVKILVFLLLIQIIFSRKMPKLPTSFKSEFKGKYAFVTGGSYLKHYI